VDVNRRHGAIPIVATVVFVATALAGCVRNDALPQIVGSPRWGDSTTVYGTHMRWSDPSLVEATIVNVGVQRFPVLRRNPMSKGPRDASLFDTTYTIAATALVTTTVKDSARYEREFQSMPRAKVIFEAWAGYKDNATILETAAAEINLAGSNEAHTTTATARFEGIGPAEAALIRRVSARWLYRE